VSEGFPGMANMERLERIVARLPEATRVDIAEWGDHPTFRVRGKNFVFSDSEARHLSLKLPKEEVAATVATDPDVDPAGYGLGRHGWIALTLDGPIDDERWCQVEEWVRTSYVSVAPRAAGPPGRGRGRLRHRVGPLPRRSGQTDVRHRRGADQLDALVAVGAAVEVVEEPRATAQEDGHDRQVQFVDQAGAQVLLHGRRAAAEAHVLAAGGVERPGQRRLDAVVDEVERRPALHRDRWSGWWVSTNTGWW